MARAIPTYQRQNLADGIQSAPNASTSVSASSPVGSALQGLGQSLGNVAGVMGYDAARQAAEERKKTEDRAAVDVSNVLSQGDVYWQEQSTVRMQAWKVGDPDMREGIGADFDKWVGESEAKLPSETARNYFRKQTAPMKARLQTNAYSFQEKSTTSKLNADSDAGMQADENVVYSDPKRLDEVYARRIEPLLARSDLSEAEKIKAADVYKRKLYLSVERGEAERDPAGWYRKRFGELRVAPGGTSATSSGGGFASAVERVFKHEGGYAANDGNTGAPVNFGINQRANPDVDVKNLTKDGAAKIYKERYWDKIGGDKIPPALQGTAMDAAVNQGPARAKEWIEKSGGDPVKFNALRRAHYEMLLQDPVNRRFRSAWMGRLASYEADASGGPGAAPAAAGEAAAVSSAPIEQPKSFTGMDWEQQAAIKSNVETRLKQGEAVFKAQVDDRLRDAAAMHKDGIVDPQQLPEEMFVRAYGAEGARMYGEYQKSRGMGEAIGSFKTQSEAEIQAALTATVPVPGEGYARADSRQAVQVQAAQAVLEQRKTDPAGYVVKNSADLKSKRAAIDDPELPADQRPALVQAFVRDSLAEQRRLGIAVPQILTPAQSDAIARRAMGAQKPEDSANLIAGLEAEYGGYFPQVFDQLVKDGKIGGEMLIIPNLPSQAAREMVSRLARVKEADLVQGIDAPSQKAVKESVEATLADMARTIPLANKQAAGTVSAYETTLRKLAYQFVQGGASASDAAEQARTMLLGEYVFEGTTRFPKSVNQSVVMAGAARVLDKQLGDIDVPRDLTGARNPAEAAAEWQSTVRSRAQWFTRQDDGGLELWSMGSNGVRYRVTRGGQGVAYTWAELSASNAAAQTDAVSAGSGARERARAFREQSRQRIEATRRQVEAEDGAK